VIAHFHYVVAPGTLMGLFAGIYHWYPKVTGRAMNKLLGQLHSWTTLVFINVVFMPMFFVGLKGVSRRLYDQTGYEMGEATMSLVRMSSWGAWLMAVAQIFFVINFFWSLRNGKKVSENPWDATTLEWAVLTNTACPGSPMTSPRSTLITPRRRNLCPPPLLPMR